MAFQSTTQSFMLKTEVEAYRFERVKWPTECKQSCVGMPAQNKWNMLQKKLRQKNCIFMKVEGILEQVNIK